MRRASRLRPLAGWIVAVTASAVLPLGWLLPGCGTDAVGIEACRQIEAARCSGLLSCPVAQGGFTSDAQVESCTLFYRDQCLHGIEATSAPTDDQAAACVAAVQATAACAKKGATSMEGCAGAALVATAAPAALSPCATILSQVDQLAACAFVVATPHADAGSPDADAASDGGDAAAE